MEIAKDATSRHLISTSYFASGGFCMNKPATTLECGFSMDWFQKDLRFQEQISRLACSSNLQISSRDMKMITLSFIQIQNPPVSLSSASPLGFIAQAWWMRLPQEHLTPQAIQRFKHATQLQLVTCSILAFGSKRIGFHKSCFSPVLSPAPSSLSISEGATLARDNSMQQSYPNSSSGANPTRQCKVVEQF